MAVKALMDFFQIWDAPVPQSVVEHVAQVEAKAVPLPPRAGYRICAEIDGETVCTYTEARCLEDMSESLYFEFPISKGYTNHSHEKILDKSASMG